MAPLRYLPILLLFTCSIHGSDKPRFNKAQWSKLLSGQPVLMAENPCLSHLRGKSYVTGAVLLNNSLESVWAVINDAEAAPSYIQDMVLARVVASQENSVLVEHGMRIKSKEYRYLVRLYPSQGQKILFKMEKGRFRALDGGWWLYPVTGGRTLLVHSLHLDPGMLSPKTLVRNSLMKKIPETLTALNAVVQQRSGYAAVR